MATPMKSLLLIGAISNFLALAACGQQAGSLQTNDAGSIEANDAVVAEADRWAQDLGHDQYLRREKATRKLIGLGTSAVDSLVIAARSGDLEVVERSVNIIAEIAIVESPADDGGAWDHLNLLASKGSGNTASRAELALSEIRVHRAIQARNALKAAGIFVGLDDFFLRSYGQHRLLIRIDDQWNSDPKSLQWLRWLSGVENARVRGKAASREVLGQLIKIPNLKKISIADATIDEGTLEPLKDLKRIHSLEFRYVALKDEYGDLLASLPIRGSLELMGTGISSETVELMRQSLPGLQINHSQGGFLGVRCLDAQNVCEITEVVTGSAAQVAGLMPRDIIIKAGDAEVHRFSDLKDEINRHIPGDEIDVEIRRRGQTKILPLKLGRNIDQ